MYLYMCAITRIYKVLMVLDAMMGMTKIESKSNGAGGTGVQ